MDDSYKITDRQEVPTPKTAAEIISTLTTIIASTVKEAGPVQGVGIGVAGLVDSNTGEIVAAPNLPLGGTPLAEILEDSTGVDCVIDNDANLAALGELYSGPGRGRRLFLGLTIGTGIGGGIICDGRLWRGAHGTAAEFGHMVVSENGPPCPCGNSGCFEQIASGRALERIAKEAVSAHPDSELARRFDGDADKVTGVTIAAAARDSVAEALDIFAEFGRRLGSGIGSLVNNFNPEMIVLGGGVASSLDLALDAIRKELRKTAIDPRAKETPLFISKLDNSAGLIGAAALIFGK